MNIAYAKYLLCIYVYDLNLIICLITFIQLLDENVYKLHVQFCRMHVFVIFLFRRIAAIGSTHKNNTAHKNRHVYKHKSQHQQRKRSEQQQKKEEIHKICLLSGKIKHKRNIWHFICVLHMEV